MRGRGTRRGLLGVRTIAPHRTRTRPLLLSFFHKNGPRSSGTLPTPGPLDLVHQHCLDDISRGLCNLLTKTWQAPRRCTRSRQTNLPPWSGRAGAPGEGQSCPTLPPAQRLEGVLPTPQRLEGVLLSCNNKGNTKWNNIKGTYTTKKTSVYPNLVPFNPSFSHSILDLIYSLPDKHFTIFPRKALL